MSSGQIHAFHVDDYASELRKICGHFTVEPPKGRDYLNGRFEFFSRSGLEFTYVDQDSSSIVRTQHDTRTDPGDNFFLILQRHGHATMCQNGVSSFLSPGDIYVVDSTKASSFCYEGRLSRQLSVNLPRKEMRHRFGERVTGGIHLKRHDPLGQAMCNILGRMVDQTLPAHSCLAESFLSVLGSHLISMEKTDRKTACSYQLIYTRANQLISTEFTNPGLSVAQIATTLGVSVRQLQRAFSITGETPHERLQDVRLQAVVDTLNSEQTPARSSIAGVAYDSGFNDVSTFYRRYKARYGRAPSLRLKRPGCRPLQ